MIDWTLMIPVGLLGLALLLAGRPLFHLLLVLTGAYFGFRFGPELLMALGLQPEPQLAWFMSAGVAVLLALLAWQLPGMTLFLWGFFAGYGLGLALIDNVLIALGAGLVVALLALAFGRTGIALLTAMVGAWLLVDTVLPSVGAGQPLPHGGIALAPWGYGATIILGLVGMFIQLRAWPQRRN